MQRELPAFVLIHGFWSDSGVWNGVAPLLAARGFRTEAFDLPGAGKNATLPASYLDRPLDPAAFATEPSPSAGLTQTERTRAVVERIRAAGRPVVLVGHSMGGATISDVAETVPELLAAVVYVTAFMLPPGTMPIAMIQHETMRDALVPSLLQADPEAVGALRMDPRSDDPDDQARFKAAFHADAVDDTPTEALQRRHCDEPLAIVRHPSQVTPERFGTIARHYIRCTDDRAIPITGQDFMIAEMDRAMGNGTTTHSLASSHSPFYSRPGELAELLARIGG